MASSLYLTLSVYCVLILLASLLGGVIPMLVRLTHKRMQLAISCVAGFILGIAVLMLLPGAIEAAGIHQVVYWMLGGMLAMFFLERFFCFHHHDVDDANIDHASCKDAPGEIQEEVNRQQHKRSGCGCGCSGDGSCGCGCGHHHDHGHKHEEHGHEHGNEQISLAAHEHKLTWSGAAVGLTLHSIIAGIALAAAMWGDAERGAFWPGIAVFLVIVLHKPFDSMTLGTLMAASGWSKGWRHIVNMLFALAVPLGAILFIIGVGGADVHGEGNTYVAYALAFSAGVFLVVSLSDLLPEIQFHHHDRVALSIALLLGLGLALAVEIFGHSRMHAGHGEGDGHNHGAASSQVHSHRHSDGTLHVEGDEHADHGHDDLMHKPLKHDGEHEEHVEGEHAKEHDHAAHSEGDGHDGHEHAEGHEAH